MFITFRHKLRKLHLSIISLIGTRVICKCKRTDRPLHRCNVAVNLFLIRVQIAAKFILRCLVRKIKTTTNCNYNCDYNNGNNFTRNNLLNARCIIIRRILPHFLLLHIVTSKCTKQKKQRDTNSLYQRNLYFSSTTKLRIGILKIWKRYKTGAKIR